MSATFPPGRDAPPPIYNGRYELRSQIARGGTAQVYLARDLLLDRPVALKVLFPELSSDSSFVERFRREAQAAANLSHPNIVPVFDWGESERTYFIVMEHVDGEPLSSLIRSQAPLPPLRAAGIAADIAKALSYAHRHGVVHRDVKPGNVLITRDGQVKVADFGIARAIGSDESVTQTGLVMGTATYFSPEQAQGLGVDGRSDVYSLGVVLYEMVTGRPPFVADTPVAIAYKHVSENAIPPRELEPRLPQPLEAVIMRAMAKNPANRYATADDLYADLERFARGEQVMAEATAAVATAAAAAEGTTLLRMDTGTQTRVLGGAAVATPLAAAAATAQGPPEMPRRRWIPWVLAALVLLVLVGALAEYGLNRLGYLGKPYTRIPSVQGLSEVTARNLLEGKGFKVVPSPRPSTTIKSGLAIESVPNGNTIEREGTDVTLVYSTGLAPIQVPDVVGQPVATAEANLKKDDFVPKQVAVRLVVGSGESPGTVSAEPQDHERLQPGQTVIIDVPTLPAEVTVPKHIYGRPLNLVQAELQTKGFTNIDPVSQLSTKVPANDVISTNPPPGTKTTSSTQITIYVSSGPGVLVPSVVGDSAGTAAGTLSSDGLTSGSPALVAAGSNGLCGTYSVGQITAQNPAPNTRVPSNTSVALTQCTSTAPTTSTSSTTTSPSTVTVQNPGPQHSDKGGPVTPLQITATDSNHSLTLTYSATGLPSGLAINPNTGVISGTPRGPPQPYQVTVTVTDSEHSTGSTSFTWTIAPKGT